MPEDMSDRVPEDMPDRMPEDLPDRLPEDMPEDMPDHMPEDMPDRMPNRMSEDMSDRMPEDLPVRKCINVMVGITRSKVILFSSTSAKHVSTRERVLPKDVTMSSFRIYFSIFPYVFLLDVHVFGFCFISYFARGVSQTCTVVEVKNRFVVTFSTFLEDAAFSICNVWLHSTLLRI